MIEIIARAFRALFGEAIVAVLILMVLFVGVFYFFTDILGCLFG
jgi:hypothetical protein